VNPRFERDPRVDQPRLARGFTLIELMIAVGILAIVTAIAIPVYNGYIRESRLAALRSNVETLRIAVEAYKLDNPLASYKHATLAAPYGYTCSAGGVCSGTSIATVYGWQPETSENAAYTYTVSNPTATVYNLYAEVDGTWWVRCQKDPAVNPPFKCCGAGDSGATNTSCP